MSKIYWNQNINCLLIEGKIDIKTLKIQKHLLMIHKK